MIKNSYKKLSEMMKKNLEPSKDFKKRFADIKYENSYIKNLFIKEVNNPKQPQKTRGCNYTKVQPTPVDNPKLIYLSPECSEMLGFDPQGLKEDKETSEYLSGNKLVDKSNPVAHCYVGHQFGILAGQLGDGRAITLGDLYGADGNQLWELQLKGSGLTPYSRNADGRAVLRSSIREFLCSEHLWSLGIPTTRALSLIGSDSTVQRDPLYSGNVIDEECAIVCRVAPTFFRFGSFEIFKSRDPLTGGSGPSIGMENEMMPKMLNYLATYHFPTLSEEYKDKEPKQLYSKMYELIVVRTAILAAYWQSYAFCHGVLNTDNMSILGLTIDFGPFGFMEFFDNFFICNHSDRHGRYCYFKQPDICKWNLNKLAEALSSQIPIEELKAILESSYDKAFKEYFYLLNSQKLGLMFSYNNEKDDKELIDLAYKMMEEFGFDFTLFFRYLSNIKLTSDDEKQISCNNFIEKMKKYSLSYDLKTRKMKPKMNPNAIKSLNDLKEVNSDVLFSYGLDPEYIDVEMKKNEEFTEFKSNYPDSSSYENQKSEKLQEWLNFYMSRLNKEFCKIKDKSMNSELLKNNLDNLINDKFLFTHPLHPNAHNNILISNCQKLIEDISDKNKISSLSDISEFQKFKLNYMNKLNPRFILRNHIAQRAIEKAEEGDYQELDKIYKIMTTPFDDHDEEIFDNMFDTSVLLAYNICVSCSS
jgi:serine/tyrosine/threonine adenylyltransferase